MHRKNIHAATAAAVMAIGVLSSPSAYSATDTHIKIGAIKGESTYKDYKDWIDVLSWSWGVSQTDQGSEKRRQRGPAVCVQDLTIAKKIDRASAELIVGTTFGDRYPDATLVVRRSGENALAFLKIKMVNVMVTSYSTGGSTGDDVPVEQVTLNFQSATGEYTPQDPATGKPGQPVAFEVDASSSKCK